MQEIPFNEEREFDPHDEKVSRIARNIGGYYRQLFEVMPIEDIREVFPVEYFPLEIWSTLRMIRQGAQDPMVRLDPYLSNAFSLMQGEEAMIFWEVTAQSPEIALYATGDLSYAHELREYMKSEGGVTQ